MRRRELIGVIGLSSFVARFESLAAQPIPRTVRLAYLAPIRIPHLVEALTGGLRDLGYVEGQNLSIEYRFAGENPERFDLLAMELVRLAPDVIVTVATPATLAARRATSSIPIVVATAGDLVRSGVVQSLARPGGNVTGVTLYSVELSQKRLEVLREAIPSVKRVGVLGNANNLYNRLQWDDTQPAGGSLGLELRPIFANGVSDLEAVFSDLEKEHLDALVLLSDATFNSERHRIARLADALRIPTMHDAREFVEAGGLISYGPNIPALSRQAATFVDKILKGALPADLPVEQPSIFELVVNQRAARLLNLTIPPTLLARADEVIE
jgi:putative tryptophan/tyrosine transport system substrate-binding protein